MERLMIKKRIGKEVIQKVIYGKKKKEANNLKEGWSEDNVQKNQRKEAAMRVVTEKRMKRGQEEVKG